MQNFFSQILNSIRVYMKRSLLGVRGIVFTGNNNSSFETPFNIVNIQLAVL